LFDLLKKKKIPVQRNWERAKKGKGMLAENCNIQEVRGTRKKEAAKDRVKLQSLAY